MSVIETVQLMDTAKCPKTSKQTSGTWHKGDTISEYLTLLHARPSTWEIKRPNHFSRTGCSASIFELTSSPSPTDNQDASLAVRLNQVKFKYQKIKQMI